MNADSLFLACMAYLLYWFNHRQCSDGFPQLCLVGSRLHGLRYRRYRYCYGFRY